MSDVVQIPGTSSLEALARYDVLDTPREEAFDRITRIVCRVLDMPMSTVTFLDGHRQWFKSRQGLDNTESARSASFCRVTLAECRPLVVPDTLEDARFRDNPLVLGEPHLRFYAGVPLRNANGTCVGTLCAMDSKPRSFDERDVAVLADLARMVETELELRILATVDSLTGVVARRAFLDEAERAVSLALRHRYDLSCISFDIDHFKTVNDTAGHAVGDAVLAATAKTVARLLRKSDIFGRLGGEEFAIILPHAGAANAAKIAEKLRARIEVQAGKTRLPQTVTASFGVACLAPAPTDLAELLASADRAMYEAKTRGRNCCVVAANRPTEAAALGRRVLKAGSIVFNRGNSVIDCTVRRLSETGARLDVITCDEVPRRFKLSIELDNFSRACTIARQEETSLEVVFDQL